MENQLNFTYLIRFSGDVTYRRHNSRSLFEKLVLRNIILAMKKHNVFFKVYKLSSRIILKTNKDVSNVLNKIFGISSFSYCNEINFENLEELAKKVFELNKNKIKNKTFAIRCRRVGKHDFNSMQVARYIGGLLNPFSNGVDLENPEVEINLEIRGKKAFVYDNVFEGSNGLPIGSGDKLISLFSGGFDSPVAAWFLAKRGCKVDFLHFAFGSLTDTIDVISVAKILADNWFYGHDSKFYIIQMNSFINEIMKNIEPRIWQVVLRRGMYLASERFSIMKNYEGMITGESVAQATSQTIRNIRVAEEGIQLPIFRPLIGWDKKDIIDLSKKIGTYESSLRVQELCSIAIGPLTPKADPEKFRKDFEKLDLSIIDKAINDYIEINLSSLNEEQILKLKEKEDYVINYIPSDAIVVNLMPEKMKIPNSLTLMDLNDEKLKNNMVIFVCEKGLTSKGLAKHYRSLGIKAYSLFEGFEGYKKLQKNAILKSQP